MQHLGLDRCTARVDHLNAIGGHGRDLPIVQHEYRARVLQDRRYVTRQDVLAVTDPDDEGRVLTCRDDHVRRVEVHDAERIAPLEASDRLPDRRGEIAVEVCFDEVCHDLRVRVGP